MHNYIEMCLIRGINLCTYLVVHLVFYNKSNNSYKQLIYIYSVRIISQTSSFFTRDNLLLASVAMQIPDGGAIDPPVKIGSDGPT